MATIVITKVIDEGTFGFHDYTEKKEDFSVFIARVSEVASNYNRVFNISYLNEDTAVIGYKED